MGPLIDIASNAIEDYGFRQIVLWSPEDVAVEWKLSAEEISVLEGPLCQALSAMPVPVEPADIPEVRRRVAAVIEEALADV